MTATVDSTIDFALIASVADQIKAVQTSINVYGYCIVRGLPNTRESILHLGQRIGNIQGHIRADADGVVGDESQEISWKDHIGEYQGVSKEEFFPHTDGSFLNGLYVKGTRPIQIAPPRMLLLQIAKQAASGGENIIVDGEKIFHYLRQHEPEIARILLHPQCMMVSRDDQMAVNVPVFEIAKDGRVKMRFRYDDKVYVPEWALGAVRRFHQLTLDPRFTTQLDTRSGDIIIIDNWRALHGRRAFENGGPNGDRKFRRVWIADDNPETLLNVAGAAHCNRSQMPFVPYISRISPLPPSQRLPISCGIVLANG